MVGQAVSELHLNRLAEAEAALQQAREKDANNAEVLANAAVLAVISGKDPKEFLSCVYPHDCWFLNYTSNMPLVLSRVSSHNTL